MGLVVLGKYRIERAIGGGFTGSVYRGRVVTDEAAVAVKEMRRDLGWIPVVGEASAKALAAARNVRSASIGRLLDIAEEDDRTLVVSDWVDAEGIDEVVEWTGRRLPVARAAAFFCQVAETLQQCHAAGLVHGDLKLQNIMVPRGGGFQRAVIVDFGIAAVLADSNVGAKGEGLVPNLHYRAPEQLMSPKTLTPAVDAYALGAVLYHVLTGQPPFPGDEPRAVVQGHMTREPARPVFLNPEVPDALSDVVMDLLAKDPFARADRMAALLDVLRPLVPPPPTRRRLAGGNAAPAPASSTVAEDEPEPEPVVVVPAEPPPVRTAVPLKEIEAQERAARERERKQREQERREREAAEREAAAREAAAREAVAREAAAREAAAREAAAREAAAREAALPPVTPARDATEEPTAPAIPAMSTVPAMPAPRSETPASASARPKRRGWVWAVIAVVFLFVAAAAVFVAHRKGWIEFGAAPAPPPSTAPSQDERESRSARWAAEDEELWADEDDSVSAEQASNDDAPPPAGIVRPELKDVSSRDIRRAKYYNTQGYRDYRHGRLDTAIANYERAIEANPNDPLYWYNAACTLAAQGRVDESIRYLEQWIARRKGETAESAAAKLDQDPDFKPLREHSQFKAFRARFAP